MPRRANEGWERLFEQKKQELIESDCRQALDITSFEQLRVALYDLATDYRDATFPDLSACRNNYAVEEMLDTVTNLNNEIPKLDAHLDFIKSEPHLQFKLQDLYETYMGELDKDNFVTYFFTSSPQRKLAQTKETIRKQTKDLQRGIQRVIESRELRRHRDVQETLSSQPLPLVEPEAKADEEGDVQYPISTVFLYRNWTFLGRDDVLASMHEVFNDAPEPSDRRTNGATSATSPTQQPRCCILRGLGGIGKTQTALQYTYLYRHEYDAIFWIQADQEHSLASTFSEISEKLQVVQEKQSHDGQGKTQAATKVMDWLKMTSRRWLMVFDNVECMEELNPYLPLDIKTAGCVILTTQRADFFPITNPETTKTFDIQSFDRRAGAELIFKYLQRDALDEDEEEKARMISDLLEGLPLALATIGGYINQSGDSVSNYYINLKTSSKAWQTSAIGPVKQYPKSLETVFDFALGKLKDKPRALINILAFLNPDFIPEQLFTDNIGAGALEFVSSKADLIDMIRILRKRQLVRRDTTRSRPFLSIHRTVQWSVLLNLSKDYDDRWRVFKQAFDLVRRCLPDVSPIDNPEPAYWAQFEKYVPQILSLRSHCLWPEPPVKLPRDFAQNLSDMSTYMWHAGLFAEGTEALLTAEDILKDNKVSNDDPLRGSTHEHLGIFASFNGVSERRYALQRREKAIDARKAEYDKIPKNQVTREDEIRRYNVESDMAFGHLQWEDFESSEEFVKGCYEQYKTWGSEEEIPFEYCKYYHIMSYVLMSKQDPVGAVEHAKRGAELAERCAGLKHSITQLTRFSLANHLYLFDELDLALQEVESVLEARRQIHGEFNHYTLETYSFAASLLAQKGRFEEAERYYLKCLDRRKRRAWNQEGVARAQFLYGQTLKELGKEEESRKEIEDALETMKHFLEEYPEWLTRDKAENDDLVVFDQMVSLWAGRYTGRLKQKPVEATISPPADAGTSLPIRNAEQNQ